MEENVQQVKLVVDERPFCIWGTDLDKRNRRFVNNLDASYFEYVAQTNIVALENEDYEQHAALALRAAYSHGLESLFSLLFASLQAPGCIYAWLALYQPGEISKLCEKIDSQQPIYSRFALKPSSWKSISELLLKTLSLEDKTLENNIRRRFPIELMRLATDYLNKENQIEYNTIKHGLRIKQGGSTLAIGSEDVPGVPAPPERMQLLNKSKFGSSFYVQERVTEDNKINLHFKHHFRNWNPQNFIYRLQIISCLMQDILVFLKIVNGDISTQSFTWPQEDTLFEDAWRPLARVSSFSMGTVFFEKPTDLVTKEAILKSYEPLSP